MSDTVVKHKVVSFTYSILNDKSEVEEQSEIPMEYIHGVDDRVFPLVVQALEGTKVGDTKEVTLSPSDGFGVYDENKTYRDKVENIPAEYQTVGAEASFRSEDGEELKMKVVSVENGEVFLDGNHAFADKTMIFKITVVGIRDASGEEITSGLKEDYELSEPNNSAVH